MKVKRLPSGLADKVGPAADELRLVARPRRSGHFSVVWRDDGRPLRSGGVPVQVSATPSDWRSLANEAARIRRAVAATVTPA